MATCLACKATVKQSLIARHMGVAHKTALGRPSGRPNWEPDVPRAEVHCFKCSALFCGGENKRGELTALLVCHLLEKHFKEEFEKQLGKHSPKCPMCPEQISFMGALKLHVIEKHQPYTMNFLRAYCPGFAPQAEASSTPPVTITLDEAGEAVSNDGAAAVDSERGTDRGARDGKTLRDEESAGVDPPLEDDGRKSAAGSDASGESVVVASPPPPPSPAPQAAAAVTAPAASSEVEVIDVEDEEDVDDPQQNPVDSSKESEKLFAAFKTECGRQEKSYKKVTKSFLKEFLGGHRSGLNREIVDKFLFLVSHVQEGSRAEWLRGSEMELFLQDLLKKPPATPINRTVEKPSGCLPSPQGRPNAIPVPNYNVTQNIARLAESTLVPEREESRNQVPLKLEDICRSIGRFSFTEPKASVPRMFESPEAVIK